MGFLFASLMSPDTTFGAEGVLWTARTNTMNMTVLGELSNTVAILAN